MSNTFKLDEIRAAAEAKYGSLDIETSTMVCRLRNPLRLAKAERDELMACQERMNADDADQEEELRNALRLVAATRAEGNALVMEIGDDLPTLATIFERYTEATQVGEASASAS